jgi:hypothetical protein
MKHFIFPPIAIFIVFGCTKSDYSTNGINSFLFIKGDMAYVDLISFLDSSSLSYNTRVISYYDPYYSAPTIIDDYLSIIDDNYYVERLMHEWEDKKKYVVRIESEKEQWIKNKRNENARQELLNWGVYEVPIKLVTIDNYAIGKYTISDLSVSFRENTFYGISYTYTQSYGKDNLAEYDALMNDIYDAMCHKYGMPYEWYCANEEPLDTKYEIAKRSPLKIDSWKTKDVDYFSNPTRSTQSVFAVQWTDGNFHVKLYKLKYSYDEYDKKNKYGSYKGAKIGFTVRNVSEKVNTITKDYENKINIKEEEIWENKRIKLEKEQLREQKLKDDLKNKI